MQGRIAVCTAAVGHGHCRAAAVIGRIAKERGASVQVVEALARTPWWFRKLYRDVYLELVSSAPRLQRWLYRVSDRPCSGTSPGEFLERRAMRKYTRLDLIKQADLLICTHFLCARVLAWRKSRGLIKAPIAVCITDQHPHGVWLCPQVDLYLVASESAREAILKWGIPADRVRVTGIPVSPEFGTISREQARRELSIPMHTPVVLLTGGGLGLGGLDEAVQGAAQISPRPHMLVVCGRDEEVHASAEDFIRESGLSANIFGFTDQMPLLMAAADVMIGKPGGLTTSEALASRLPMVLLKPIPGQEEMNADRLVAMGAAILEYDPVQAGRLGAQLCNDPERLTEMKARIAAAGAGFDAGTMGDALSALLNGAPSGIG